MFGIARAGHWSAWSGAPTITAIDFAGVGSITATRDLAMRGFKHNCCGNRLAGTDVAKESYVDTSNLTSVSAYDANGYAVMIPFKIDVSAWIAEGGNGISINQLIEDPENGGSRYCNFTISLADSNTTIQVGGGYGNYKPFGANNDDGDTIAASALDGKWAQLVMVCGSDTNNYQDWSPSFTNPEDNRFHRWCWFDIESGNLIGKLDWADWNYGGSDFVDLTQSGTSTQAYTSYNFPYTHSTDPRLEIDIGMNGGSDGGFVETGGYWGAFNQTFDPLQVDSGMLGHAADTIAGCEAFVNAFANGRDLVVRAGDESLSAASKQWGFQVTNPRFNAADTNDQGMSVGYGFTADPETDGDYTSTTIEVAL